MQCATHPEVETHVTCQKCGVAICIRCMVQTPVGYRCRTCARLRPNPLRTLTAEQAARVLGAALGMALLAGIGWGLIKPLFGLLSVIAAFGIGYVIAEAVSAAALRKPAPVLPYVAAATAALGFLIGNVMDWVFWSDVSFGQALQHAADFDERGVVWGVLSMLLSIAMAYTRLR